MALLSCPVSDDRMKKSNRARHLLLGVAALMACGPGGAEDTAQTSSPAGRLVIIGGALKADNSAVYDAVVAGRAGDGPLCVVPTASADAQEAMSGAVRVLAGFAGDDPVTGVLLTTEDPARAQDPSVAAELAACSGFYFTGGSQSRILDVFLPAGDTTAAYRALVQRWREGAVVAGSSAGAAMMSRVMISGGSSAEAVSVGIASGPDEDGVQIRPGMGFFEPLLDQHFLARGRIGRLLVSVIREDLPDVGLGIDENTALVVDGENARVVGASGVVVVDGRAARRTGPHRASGVTVTLAGAGDVLDLRTLDVRRSDDKTAMLVEDRELEQPDDPFARWAFLHLIEGLSRSEAEGASFVVSEGTLRISKATGFAGWTAGSGTGVEGTPQGLSAGPFQVDLTGPG